MNTSKHIVTAWHALAARVIIKKADDSVTSSNTLLRPEAMKYLRSQILFCKNSSWQIHNRKFIFQKERYTICMILNSGSHEVIGNFPELFLKFLKLRNKISVWEFWRIGRQSFHCVNYFTVQLVCVRIPNLANVIALNVMHFLLLWSPYCIMTSDCSWRDWPTIPVMRWWAVQCLIIFPASMWSINEWWMQHLFSAGLTVNMNASPLQDPRVGLGMCRRGNVLPMPATEPWAFIS